MSGIKSRLFTKLMSTTAVMALMLLSACGVNNNRQVGMSAADKAPNQAISDLGNTQSSQVKLAKVDNQDAKKSYSDEELVKELPGFKNGYKEVNGFKIHYVEGGEGEPLFLLPGWPETWYAYHKIMPDLAKKYHVYSIDYRGMGSSGKPESGYDFKTMASDIYALAQQLGYTKIDIAGHDVGAPIAYAYAAQYPQATKKVALLEVPHPNEDWLKIPVLAPSVVYDESNPNHPRFPWWFAFNTIPGLPEQLLQGKQQQDIFYNWIFDYLAYDKTAISEKERAIYISAYAKPDALRASNDWYKGIIQDIQDLKTYPKLTVPILGLSSEFNVDSLNSFFQKYTTDSKLVKLDKTGHWIAEESPQETIKNLSEFFN
ncbi:alpha/beta fold hydrolase [Paenibacillus aestuarii]|uniref:Alpha/beta fold hydrolase n=1 Tax=Paenibacillus aestuarii TaxID=516965 RepID=A0ABW0KGJ4_9BACL